LIRKPEGTRPLEDLGVDGRTILDRILGNAVVMCGLGGSGYGPVAGSCMHSNGPLGCIKGGEFD